MPYKYVAVKQFVKYIEGFNLLAELKNKYFKNFEFCHIVNLFNSVTL